ncbi:hypothetical protein [Sphingomonas sp. PB2P19]|uniref:hypothetical protein n=1 Tax=Sphingomonas rhamnosi TaxID=3096156 RepID=UPI002FC6D0D2
MADVERREPVGVPRARSLFKRRDDGRLVLSTRVEPLPQRNLGVRPVQPGVGQPNVWVLPERQQLLFAVDLHLKRESLEPFGRTRRQSPSPSVSL